MPAGQLASANYLREESTKKLVAWNVQGGGGRRIHRIATELIQRDADVIVLGEYVRGRSDSLTALLAAAGWSHIALSGPPEGYGGVAIASRLRLVPMPATNDLGPQALFRHIGVAVPDAAIELRGIYGPLARDPHQVFWEGLLASLASSRDGAVLALVDFNSGSPGADTPGPALFSSRYFDALMGVGYQDLWRRMNGPEARQYTWESKRKDQIFPFPLDHAFGSEAVANRTVGCSYDHEVRQAKLSDHSLMTIELAEAPPGS